MLPKLSSQSKVNKFLALFVFLFSSIIYILTTSPTVALWDCGESLASAACLGIPHPPGTPLLIPMGKVFLMVFGFLKDPGFRLNLLSVFGSALTVMFIYLIIIRSLLSVMGEPDTMSKRLSLYCGGIVGALFCAFSNTFWFCSLDFSEQCNICLLPAVITIWLAIIWAQSKDVKRDRLLLLIAYIAFAGIGMHMISMITLPAVFLFVMMVDVEKRKDWRLWITGLGLSTSMYNLSNFIIISLALTVITFVVMLLKGKNQKKWQFVFWFSFLAVLGFSNHLYMPIRANLNPSIDENHPVTWESFTGALDRKQYGSESMVSRSFWRRGTLAHQFGIESNMGYGGYHLTQFFHFLPTDWQKDFFPQNPALGFVKLLVYLIPTAFMLFAWFYFYKKNKNIATLLILVTLLTTVVLAWYMNFADGTRPEHRDYLDWMRSGQQGQMPVEHREVRVRDYFYNAGFMFFGMWIGIATTCILTFLFTNKNKLLRTTVAPILLVAFFVSPVLPLTQNYKERDRHMNWLPFDSAYNFLMSCDKDGILITNGDNDTFPLWALQEAYGIRKDVRVVNLSLLNTEWYIKQLKDLEPKAPISFTHSQIDALNVELNPFTQPTPYTLPNAGISVVIPGRAQQNALRVQDKVVLNIVDCNKWKKPIYFAATVSEDNFMGLDPYLQMQGLVMRVNEKPVNPEFRIDLAKTVYLLDKVYRFGTAKITNDPADEAVRGLQTNYTACYIELALALRKPLGDKKTAIDSLEKQIAAASAKGSAMVDEKKAMLSVMQRGYRDTLDIVINQLGKCAKLIPDDWRPRALLHEFLMNHNRLKDAEENAHAAFESDPANPQFIKMYVQILEMQGKINEAISVLNVLVKRDPDSFEGYANLAKDYTLVKKYDSANMILGSYESTHPGDRRVSQMRQELFPIASSASASQ